MNNFFNPVGANMGNNVVGYFATVPFGNNQNVATIGTDKAVDGLQGNNGVLTNSLLGGVSGMALGNSMGSASLGMIATLMQRVLNELMNLLNQPPAQSPYYPQGLSNTGNFYPSQNNYGVGGPAMSGIGGPANSSPQMPTSPMGAYSMTPANFGGYGGVMMVACFPLQGGIGGPSSESFGIGGPATSSKAVEGGKLEQKEPGDPINYTTSGGYKIEIDGTTVKITDPCGKNTVKQWGDPHEAFNGKTVKDWEGKERTLILEDGTKITMNADGPKGVILNTSIYDGNQSIQIDNKKKHIDQVLFDPQQTGTKERMQPDGETSYIGHNQKGEYVFQTIYNQDENLGITNSYKLLAKGEATANWNSGNVGIYNQPQLFWMN